MCQTWKVEIHITQGPAYNEQTGAKETARYKWIFVLTNLFNIAVNDFDAKKFARHSWVLVISGTNCSVSKAFVLLCK